MNQAVELNKAQIADLEKIYNCKFDTLIIAEKQAEGGVGVVFRGETEDGVQNFKHKFDAKSLESKKEPKKNGKKAVKEEHKA